VKFLVFFLAHVRNRHGASVFCTGHGYLGGAFTKYPIFLQILFYGDSVFGEIWLLIFSGCDPGPCGCSYKTQSCFFFSFM
jgi:hypothetical protein